MQRITFVPGAVATPNPITIPTTVPDIEAVLAAQIIRLPAGITIPDHAQADILGAIADHPVTGGGGAASVAYAAGALTDTGAGGAIAHAAGAAAVAHGASGGASPVVAAVATRLTSRTISLDVNTTWGDLLTLEYIEVGERVPVS